MKKVNVPLLILLAMSIVLMASGMFVLVSIVSDELNASQLWAWLLGIPIGAGGILWIAREMKN